MTTTASSGSETETEMGTGVTVAAEAAGPFAGLAPVDPLVQIAVQQFYAQEAWLLDERHLYAWLDLWDEQATSALYVREKVVRKGTTAATDAAPTQLLVEDDKPFLTLRVRRLDTGMAHAEKPPSITRRLITNVQVVSDDGQELVARASFHVYQARLETDDQAFYGKREDRLRRLPAGSPTPFQILRRETVLDHVTVPRTLTIFF